MGKIEMSVKLVFGRSGSGKTTHCINSAIECAKKNNAYIIVPDQFSHKSEKLLLEKIEASFENTVSVITFKRLAERIFERSHLARNKRLSPSGKAMLVMRAIYLEKKNFVVYKKAAEKSGFARKVCDIISEFKRYGIDSKALEELALKIENKMLKGKVYDLCLIYKRYEKLVSDEYTDSQDDLFLAAAKLTELDYLNGADVFIDEFSDFLPQHFALIEVILKKAKNVYFYIRYEEGEFFCEAASAVESIKELCYRFGLDLKIERLKENLRYKEKPDLLALERGYTKYKSDVYAGECDNVSIFESSGMNEEAENLCGKIVELVREGKYKFGDICVACGDMAAYSKILKLCFDIYDIPYFMAEKELASENPFVKTVLSAINIFNCSYSYESMFLYLKSGFSNLTNEETDILENYVLKYGISKKQWLSEEKWEYKKDILSDDDEDADDSVEQIRQKAIAPLLKLYETLGRKNTVRAAAEGIFEFMREIGLDKRAFEMIEHFKNENQLFKANMYSKAYNGILNILDQCVLICGSDKIGVEQLYNMLLAGFENEASALVPQRAEEVMVCSVSDARAAECKVMFCIGTNMGEFVSFSAVEGMITDDEREMLEGCGIRLAKTAKRKIADGRAIVYSVLTKAEDKLFLSYSLADDEYCALHASPVCDKAKSILKNIKISDNLENEKTFSYMYQSKEAAYLNLCMQLSKKRAGKKIDDVWYEIYRYFLKRDEFKNKTMLLKRGLNESFEAKKLSKEAMGLVYENGINSSVSRLERYICCPFSYFVEFTLKAKERKILKLGAPDIGSIMHGILEEFVKLCVRLKIDWKSISEEEVLSMLKAITADYTAKIFNRSTIDTKSNRYIIERIEKNLFRCAMLLVRHIRDGKFEPIGCEVAFGARSDIKAAIIDLTSGKKLKIHGIIDRVDKFEDETGTYFRVIDYKSGSKEFSLAKLFYGMDLQLALYLKVVCGEGGKPGGMLYFKIKEPMQSGNEFADEESIKKGITEQMKLDGIVLKSENVISAMDSYMGKQSEIIPVAYKNDGGFTVASKVATMAEFERIFKHLKKQLKDIGDKILDGRIEISPSVYENSSPCEYCKYNGICRFDKRCGKYRTLPKMKRDEVYESLFKMYGKEDGSGN